MGKSCAMPAVCLHVCRSGRACLPAGFAPRPPNQPAAAHLFLQRSRSASGRTAVTGSLAQAALARWAAQQLCALSGAYLLPWACAPGRRQGPPPHRTAATQRWMHVSCLQSLRTAFFMPLLQVYKALRHGAQPVAIKVLAVSAQSPLLQLWHTASTLA